MRSVVGRIAAVLALLLATAAVVVRAPPPPFPGARERRARETERRDADDAGARERRRRRRAATEIRHEGGWCQEAALYAAPSVSGGDDGDGTSDGGASAAAGAGAGGVVESLTTASPYGVVFSLENAAGAADAVDVTSLSVHMNATVAANYSLYAAGGSYLSKRDADGTVLRSSLGAALDDDEGRPWTLVASGSFDPSVLVDSDEDGAVTIPMGTKGGDGPARYVRLLPGRTASFYLTTSVAGVLTVERDGGLEGEAEDESAEVEGGYDGLTVRVGRGVALPVWTDVVGLGASDLDALYYPARFLGKVWARRRGPCPPAPAPSAAPVTDATETGVPTYATETDVPSRMPSSAPTSAAPTSAAPTTAAPTTRAPTTGSPTAGTPTAATPASGSPTTEAPTTRAPSSGAPAPTPSALLTALPTYSPSAEPPPRTFAGAWDYLTVDDLAFDVHHPVAERDAMGGYVIGNVTNSYREIFADPSTVLHDMVTSFGLGFSERDGDGPRVNRTSDAANCSFVEDQGITNDASFECGRYSLVLTFRHGRRYPGGRIHGLLLDAASSADRGGASGDLVARYVGGRAVRSDQVVTFRNARDVDGDDLPAFCDAMGGYYRERVAGDYVVLDVQCVGFAFASDGDDDGEPRGRRTRRRLQEGVDRRWPRGEFETELAIVGKCRPADPREGGRGCGEDFGRILEDSINRDPRDVGRTLVERGLTALTGSTAEAREKTADSSPPVSAPVRPRPAPPAESVAPDNAPADAGTWSDRIPFGTYGIVAIVGISMVGLLIAGFVFYMGLRRLRSKNDLEAHNEDEENLPTADREADVASLVTGNIAGAAFVDVSVSLSQSGSDSSKAETPDHYSGRDPNIFGEVVGGDGREAALPRGKTNESSKGWSCDDFMDAAEQSTEEAQEEAPRGPNPTRRTIPMNAAADPFILTKVLDQGGDSDERRSTVAEDQEMIQRNITADKDPRRAARRRSRGEKVENGRPRRRTTESTGGCSSDDIIDTEKQSEEELRQEMLRQGVTPAAIAAFEERIHRKILGEGGNSKERRSAVAEEEQKRTRRKIATNKDSQRTSRRRTHSQKFGNGHAASWPQRVTTKSTRRCISDDFMEDEDLSTEELHQRANPMNIVADQERIRRKILGLAKDQERIQRKIEADKDLRRAARRHSLGGKVGNGRAVSRPRRRSHSLGGKVGNGHAVSRPRRRRTESTRVCSDDFMDEVGNGRTVSGPRRRRTGSTRVCSDDFMDD